MSYFTFNGISTEKYGIKAYRSKSFELAERDVEYVEVAGRHGNLSYDNERFKPFKRTYQCICYNKDDFQSFIQDIYSDGGLNLRIEDGEEPDVYVMASISSFPTSIKTRYNKVRFDIEFICQPQKWLKSGELVQTLVKESSSYSSEEGCVTAMYKLDNPSNQIASPVFSFLIGDGTPIAGELDYGLAYGGSFELNGVKITITDGITITGDYPNTRRMIIDTNLMEIYLADADDNIIIGAGNYVKLSDSEGNPVYEFPKVEKGINDIVVKIKCQESDSSIATKKAIRIKCIGRWWRL